MITRVYKVLLIHTGKIPHYRVAIYNYLFTSLKKDGFELIVLSDGIQVDNPHEVLFRFIEMPLSTFGIVRVISKEQVSIIIDFMGLRDLYLFPTYIIAKGILRKKIIYWGQGRDLLDADSLFKNIAYAIEQTLCDAIILYADHLKKYVPRYLQKKIFIANNTLYMDYPGLPAGITKQSILERYGIRTSKNIICMGRMQKRKRIDILVQAIKLINRPDVGLILVGPDEEGVLSEIHGNNIFKLGPIYGNQKFDLLAASDLYCLPGAVGLSIIDAFHCGLPLITETGDESAEIMYLKDGINGFFVKRGDVKDLASKITMLIDDDNLRNKFSKAAKREIEENGRIEIMCSGFRNALNFVSRTM